MEKLTSNQIAEIEEMWFYKTAPDYWDNWMTKFSKWWLWDDWAKYETWIHYDEETWEWTMWRHCTYDQDIKPESLEDIKTLIRMIA